MFEIQTKNVLNTFGYIELNTHFLKIHEDDT